MALPIGIPGRAVVAGAGTLPAAFRTRHSMTIKRALFFLLMTLLPIDGTDFLRLPVGEFRASFNDIIVVVLLYLDFLDGMLRGYRGTHMLRFLSALVLAILAFSAVSLLYVPGVGFAYDVKMTLNFAELLIIVFLALRIVTDVKTLETALTALVLGASIVALGTALKSAGFDIPGDVRTSARYHIGPFLVGVTGIVGRGLSFDMALLGAFPVVLVGRVARSVPARAILVALLGFGGILTYSRSLWLALAIEVVVVLALDSILETRVLPRIFAMCGVLTAGAYLAIEGPGLYEALVRLRPQTVTSRLAGYEYAWRLATASPLEFLFGAGKGLFASTFVYAGVPHNFFLDLLVSKGVLTLAAFVLFLGVLMAGLFRLVFDRRGRPEPVRRLALVLLSAMVGTLSEGLFAPITTSMNFLAILALSGALIAMTESPVTAHALQPHGTH